MADVALPPLPRRQRLAGRGLLLALFLGLLSFAAVSLMRVRCEQEYLLMAAGGGYLLLTTGERIALNQRQCHLVAGGVRVPLPSWLSPLYP